MKRDAAFEVCGLEALVKFKPKAKGNHIYLAINIIRAIEQLKK